MSLACGEWLALGWREFAKSSELLELSERLATIEGTEGTRAMAEVKRKHWQPSD